MEPLRGWNVKLLMHDKSLTIIQENSASHQGHQLLHDKSQDPGEKCMAPFSFQEHDGSSLAQPHRVPTLTPAILASEGNNNSKAACRTWLKSKTLSLVESQRGNFLKHWTSSWYNYWKYPCSLPLSQPKVSQTRTRLWYRTSKQKFLNKKGLYTLLIRILHWNSSTNLR